MTSEELNKGKELIVGLLNSIFSSGDGYQISYDYDDTSFIIDFISEGDKFPIVTKRLIMEAIHSNFRKAS